MEPRLGFIHEKLDIKILILFVLNRVDVPMDMPTLTEITLVDGAINYFDFTECVADLVKTEHLHLSCNKYSITEKGKTNGEITETSLPFSVRVKAEKLASELRSRLKRDSLILTERNIRRGGGYDVSLSLSDGLGVIMSATLFAPDEEGAKSLESGFRRNAEKAYNKLLEGILEK